MTNAALWLEPLDLPHKALRIALVRRALADVGIEEAESNRSPYIDRLLLDAGTAVGQPWCAAALRMWCKDVAAWFPPSGAASCDVWMQGAKQRGTWRENGYAPLPGDVVVYGVPGDANHIGLIARATKRGLRAVEGNTSFAGFSREGIACDYKPVTATRVLGYIVCSGVALS